jgi:hypothetical protein
MQCSSLANAFTELQMHLTCQLASAYLWRRGHQETAKVGATKTICLAMVRAEVCANATETNVQILHE